MAWFSGAVHATSSRIKKSSVEFSDYQCGTVASAVAVVIGRFWLEAGT